MPFDRASQAPQDHPEKTALPEPFRYFLFEPNYFIIFHPLIVWSGEAHRLFGY